MLTPEAQAELARKRTRQFEFDYEQQELIRIHPVQDGYLWEDGRLELTHDKAQTGESDWSRFSRDKGHGLALSHYHRLNKFRPRITAKLLVKLTGLERHDFLDLTRADQHRIQELLLALLPELDAIVYEAKKRKYLGCRSSEEYRDRSVHRTHESLRRRAQKVRDKSDYSPQEIPTTNQSPENE